jgi:hypothetical protein
MLEQNTHPPCHCLHPKTIPAHAKPIAQLDRHKCRRGSHSNSLNHKGVYRVSLLLNPDTAMAIEVEDVTISLGNLGLEERTHHSLCDSLASFQDAVHSSARIAGAINSQILQYTSEADAAFLSTALSTTEVCLLYENTKKLVDTTRTLNTTIEAFNTMIENAIITRLGLLGGYSTTDVSSRPLAGKLLSHFDKKIRNIIRDVLDRTRDESLLWKVAEKCYEEANRFRGALNADDYLVPLGEAKLGWPFDEDYESEAYYDHQERFCSDENYAKSFQARKNRELEKEELYKRSWIDFRVTVLNESPGGPTLFYPQLSPSSRTLEVEDVPRYLFRTFDVASHGTNDDNKIASVKSRIGLLEQRRIDLLQRERIDAAKRLHCHLDKSTPTAEEDDNLMSWTSSLLFAIQYAIWKSQRRQPGDIKICVVDTREFPQGQFARDLWLFEAIESKTLPQGPARDFFRFRQDRSDYYNGEYLSQGTVNIANRSCIMSLQNLRDAGLSELYPEFDDPEGRTRWAKRALELRKTWSTKQGTSERDVELALQIARKCFKSFAPVDIAAVLLTFKNRKMMKPKQPGK